MFSTNRFINKDVLGKLFSFNLLDLPSCWINVNSVPVEATQIAASMSGKLYPVFKACAEHITLHKGEEAACSTAALSFVFILEW